MMVWEVWRNLEGNLKNNQTLITMSATTKLLEREREAQIEMTKQLTIQERILRQKPKEHEKLTGDGNYKYVFNCMKARASSNTIAMLKDDNGNILQKQTDIEKEMLKFSVADRLPCIDLTIMRQRARITQQQQMEMCLQSPKMK